MTVQVKRTGDGARQKNGRAEGGAVIIGESQGYGGSGRTVNGADILLRRMVQVESPVELRADVSALGFWKRGTNSPCKGG